MVNQNFLNYKRYVYVGVFPSLESSYWWLQNKQPIENGALISPINQPIEILQNRKNTCVKNRIVCN